MRVLYSKSSPLSRLLNGAMHLWFEVAKLAPLSSVGGQSGKQSFESSQKLAKKVLTGILKNISINKNY